MIINQDLPRWIAASVNAFFSTVIAPSNLKFYGIGQERTSSDLEDWCELRQDGPYCSPRGKNQIRVYIEINILVSSIKDEKDLYKYQKDIGIAASAFPGDLQIFKFLTSGSNISPDSLGCLTLKEYGNERLEISNFDQREADVKIVQGTVEGHYEGYFDSALLT